MSSPSLLATPNWPHGMNPSSTVSWIVTLPSQYQALIQFVNVSQPKCKEMHTAISVKMLGHEEEITSRSEYEQVEDELLVPHSFYLNMSNCIPEEGQFGAVTKITLQKKTSKQAGLILYTTVEKEIHTLLKFNQLITPCLDFASTDLLAILLGIAGALLLLLIVLAVVCIVTK